MKKICLMIVLSFFGLAQAQEAKQAQENPQTAQPEISRADKIKALSQFNSPADLLAVGQGAYQQKDFEVMETAFKRLHDLRPYRSDYQFMLAKAYALQGKKTPAYDALLKLKEQGLSFEMQGDADFEKIRGYEVYGFLEEGFATNKQPFGTAEKLLQLNRDDLLIEGMVYDADEQRYLVGSMTEGAVFSVDKKGRLKPFIKASDKNGLLGVVSLAIDQQRKHLWVSSSASAHFKGIKFQDAGRASLYQFDLKSGKLLNRYDAPGAGSHFLMYVTVAPDGTVYASDSIQPTVYRLKPGAEGLDVLFSAPGFTGLRGLAVDGSGKFLYFSDYELGLFGVVLATGKSFIVNAGKNQNLSGIEGLYWYQNSLVMIQNAHQPQRVMRMQVDANGQAVHIQPMLANHEDFRFPTTAAVAGDQIVVLSESHRNLYNPKTGKPVEKAQLRKPVLLSADLNFQWTPK